MTRKSEIARVCGCAVLCCVTLLFDTTVAAENTLPVYQDPTGDQAIADGRKLTIDFSALRELWSYSNTTMDVPSLSENQSRSYFGDTTFQSWSYYDENGVLQPGVVRFTNFLFSDWAVGHDDDNGRDNAVNSSIVFMPFTKVGKQVDTIDEMDSVVFHPKWELRTTSEAPNNKSWTTFSGVAIAAPVLENPPYAALTRAKDAATLRLESNPPTSTCEKNSNLTLDMCWTLAVDAGYSKFEGNVYFVDQWGDTESGEKSLGIHMNTGSSTGDEPFVRKSHLSIFNDDGGDYSDVVIGAAGSRRVRVTPHGTEFVYPTGPETENLIFATTNTGINNNTKGVKHKRVAFSRTEQEWNAPGGMGRYVQIEWTPPFDDENYTVSCSVQMTEGSNPPMLGFLRWFDRYGVWAEVEPAIGSFPIGGVLHCTAIHD